MSPKARGGRVDARDVPPAVYPEREDTHLLLPFARTAGDRSLLDIGTGNGRLALEAARHGARTVATDLNPEALRGLRSVARAERLPVEVVRTDLARGLGSFDRVLANPPYLPTQHDQRTEDRWHDLAVDGGRDGCRVLARIVRELPEHLAAGGHAYVLVSSVQSAPALARVRDGWTARGGALAAAAERSLEGERLTVWDLWLDRGAKPAPP